ncbi:ribonuclease III domain-containing protein [Crucibulum laeve]|uniref:Ribonuclease III domain-containing protein n=1 Tax=Crucibulum laeve TaxID=68775 RepID=A0A5C3MEH8_9AGAR|nr:ribonuclease III domain-containing protein [Crucibulum laeve]
MFGAFAFDAEPHVPSPQIYQALAINSLRLRRSRPDFGPDSVLLPPLPAIRSEAIRQQVFTHRSLHGRPTHIFEDHPNDLSPDNEKFEHLGDTVLGLCVTSLLAEMYPGLHVGPSTKIRSLVVGNVTLAEISLMYKLPDFLRLHAAQAITLRASTNVQVFLLIRKQSFVGGLYVDQGLDAVKRWLDPLLRPYAKSAYLAVRQQHGLPALPTPGPSKRPSFEIYPPSQEIPITPTVGHLALFNQETQKRNLPIEWIYYDGAVEHEYAHPGVAVGDLVKGTKTTPVWYVKIQVDGEIYGLGRGGTKKAARNEAAKQGLGRMGIFVWWVYF